ncbi:MAG TPA: glycosyltransferase family 9 protein, partial [Microlunatus sp.]|nr:glycosyltransferase family 9 protein [Microlunatus sp.]
AVRAVARAARRVTMLVAPGQLPAARLLPGVDDVLGFEAGWVRLDPPPVDGRAVRRLVRRIRRAQIDTALVLTSYHQSPLPIALLLRMAGVSWVGAVSEDYPGSLLDLRHRVPDDLPEAERGLSLAEAAGFSADGNGARLAIRRPLPSAPGWIPTRPYLAGPPGAAVPARRPSTSTSRAVVRALVADGWPVVVTGGAAEVPLTAEVAAGDAVDAGGRLTLPELAAVLDGAAVVVAPNTGPSHLAAAVGTPVVALHAPVVRFAQWGPYGVPTVRLGDQSAPCRMTRARTCPVPGHPCLDTIDPAEVVTAVHSLTGVRPAPPTTVTAGGPRD